MQTHQIDSGFRTRQKLVSYSLTCLLVLIVFKCALRHTFFINKIMGCGKNLSSLRESIYIYMIFLIRNLMAMLA